LGQSRHFFSNFFEDEQDPKIITEQIKIKIRPNTFLIVMFLLLITAKSIKIASNNIFIVNLADTLAHTYG